MKRFCAFLLLTFVFAAFASAADPFCGDAKDPLREQKAIFNGLLRTSESAALPEPMATPPLGTLPVTAAQRPTTQPSTVSFSKRSTESDQRSRQSLEAQRPTSWRSSRQSVPQARASSRLPATRDGVPSPELQSKQQSVNTANRRIPKPDWRIGTTNTTKQRTRRRISKAVKKPARISINDAKPIGMSVVERLKARGESKNRIRRVGYDIEDLQRLLEGQAKSSAASSGQPFQQPLPIKEAPQKSPSPSVVEPNVESGIPAFDPIDSDPEPLFDFEETYEIAAPPRPEMQEKSPSDEVESVLDQLRRELRKEMEDARKAEEAAREKRRQKAVETVIPRSPPQSIDNAANSRLDLTLDLDEEEDAEPAPEPDVTGSDADTPPIPESFNEVPDNPSHWNDTPWAFRNELTQTEEYDPCEPVYCRQMWDCAGGRCQTWIERAMRSIDRTTQVTYGKCNDCGRVGANAIVPGNRAICSPAFSSRSNVGVWRRSPRRIAASRVTSGEFLGTSATGIGLVSYNDSCTGDSCTSSPDADGCTSDDSCTLSAGCTGTGSCSSGCTGGCPSGACNSGCGRCSRETEPWTAWGSLFGCKPRIMLSGWASAGYHSRANGRFNDHPDGFNVHQTWFALERVADTTNRAFDWGFRVDAMYGADAADTQAFGGNPGRWDYQNGLDHGRYGWALPQAYGELAYGDTSVIMGHFYTLMGYEVVPAPDNFFYSHSMTMYLSEPFTHTGVLARKTHSDVLESYYGWTLGWDTGFDQVDNGNSFLGGFKLQLSDNFSATYTTSFGDFGARGTGYAHSIVMAANPTDQWGVVFQSDLLRIQEEDNVSASAYVMRHLTDFASIGSRLEWWKGDTVTGYAPFDITLPANGTFSYCAATFGANFRVGTNITIRPEGRIDWSPALDYSVGTGAVDVVMTF